VTDAPLSPPAAQPGELIAVRLPNWVGDVCMALPALAHLRAAGMRLHCFGKGWARDLLAGYPDRVEALPKGWRAAAAALRASGARRGVLFTNSFSSAWTMRWAGIRATGYARDLRGWLLDTAPRRRRDAHEVESFWTLALAENLQDGGWPGYLGEAPPPAQPPALELVLAARHRAEAAVALAAAGVTGHYQVLCPLAVGTVAGMSKQWPSFPLLCRGLIEQGERVLACPGPGEEAACAALLPGATLVPGLGLGAYAALLAGADRVVANDSGPLHLAVAVGAPVLGIFGVTDPRRTRPWGPNGAVVGDGMGWPTVQAVWESLRQLPPRAQAAATSSR
jgi:heptosyltransferase-2